MILTILLFLAVLSVLVLAHEWGHFYTAKRMGVAVEEFGLGFPPRLWSWKGKDGMTWSLNALPLGGFVKLKGEGQDGREGADSFANKSIAARLLILLAGVAMNLVVAAVCLTIVFMVGVTTIIDGDVPKNGIMTNAHITITQVLPDSPAIEKIKPGDQLISINDLSFTSAIEARDYLREHSSAENTSFKLTLDRSGEEINVDVAPQAIAALDARGIGVAIEETATLRYPWYVAPIKGVETTLMYTAAVIVGLFDLIKGLVTGGGVSADVSGPIGIAQMTGEVAKLGVSSFLQFIALLSINLAVLNGFPFPALDGGRAAFVILEAIRRKPASATIEAIVHNLGFALLMIVVILVTFRDIVHAL